MMETRDNEFPDKVDVYYLCLSHIDYMRDCDDPTLDDIIWGPVAEHYIDLYEESLNELFRSGNSL